MTVTAISAYARERLAERMIPLAADYACAMRDEDSEALGRRLDAMTRQELYGLITVLGAMVDLGQPVGDALAWIEWEDVPSLACLPPSRSAASASARRQEYARLRGEGLSPQEAAQELGVCGRTVDRYETAMRQQEGTAA
jgi:DNA-binding NarL/FixJ family response regulator